MSLPVRSETRRQSELIDETRKSLRRAKDLVKELKTSDPLVHNEDLRLVVKKSIKRIKKALAGVDKLAKEWIDRVELSDS